MRKMGKRAADMTFLLFIFLFFGIAWMILPNAPRIVARPFIILLKYIWEPETNKVRKETVKRLRELYVDQDIPAETAVLMTTSEEGITEEELYSAFRAIDANDLMDIITSTKKSRLTMALRLMRKIKANL